MRKYFLLFILLLCLAARGQTFGDIDLNGLPQSTKAQALRYWFDENSFSIQTTDQLSGSHTLDVSDLTEGLHTLHCQVLGAEGASYYIASAIFIKFKDDNTSAAVTAKKLMYWYDDETTVNTLNMENGAVILDASSLVDGLHTLHYQILCSDGQMTPSQSAIFLRMSMESKYTSAKSIHYWFDDKSLGARTIAASNGTMMLDATALGTGLHTLYYQITDSEDNLCPPVARLFFKDFEKAVASGENEITEYQYWLNDNSQTMQNVKLDAATNPYTLIALLPVQKEPLRSKQFHFEITEGQPTIYAENDFHIRFHDLYKHGV